MLPLLVNDFNFFKIIAAVGTPLNLSVSGMIVVIKSVLINFLEETVHDKVALPVYCTDAFLGSITQPDPAFHVPTRNWTSLIEIMLVAPPCIIFCFSCSKTPMKSGVVLKFPTPV